MGAHPSFLKYLEDDINFQFDFTFLVAVRWQYIQDNSGVRSMRFHRSGVHEAVNYEMFGPGLIYFPPQVCLVELVGWDGPCGCGGTCEGGLRRPFLLGQRLPTPDDLRVALLGYVAKYGVPKESDLPPLVVGQLLYRAALRRFYTEQGPKAANSFKYIPYDGSLGGTRTAAHKYARDVVCAHYRTKDIEPPSSFTSEWIEDNGSFCYYELSGQLVEVGKGERVCPMNASLEHPHFCNGSCEGGLRKNYALWSADLDAEGQLSAKERRLAKVAKANAERLLGQLEIPPSALYK